MPARSRERRHDVLVLGEIAENSEQEHDCIDSSTEIEASDVRLVQFELRLGGRLFARDLEHRGGALDADDVVAQRVQVDAVVPGSAAEIEHRPDLRAPVLDEELLEELALALVVLLAVEVIVRRGVQ